MGDVLQQIPRGDTALMGTNEEAFESKIAAMEVGYFNDKYLRQMKDAYGSQIEQEVRRFKRQPMFNRGTYARVLIKERLGEAFVSKLGGNSLVQIISLGAGFDSFGFKLLEAWKDDESEGESGHGNAAKGIRYVEIDLGPVVQRKKAIGISFLRQGDLFSRVEQSDDHWYGEVKRAQTDKKESRISGYGLYSWDLRDSKGLSCTLEKAGLDRNKPTLVIAEISLVYLEPEHSDAVIELLGQWLGEQRVFINMEHIARGDQFGKQMDENVAARGSVLLGMRAYPDMESQCRRFLQLGWPDCQAYTMLELWKRCVSVGDMNDLQQVEWLDEMEELNLLLEHCCIVVASSSSSSASSHSSNGENGVVDTNMNIDSLISHLRLGP